jgi:hypothetical protein
MKFSLSWIINDDGGNTHLVDLSTIGYYLKLLKNNSGSITLDRLDNEIGAISLQVLSDKNQYLLTLGEDNGSEYIVRSYFNKLAKGEMIDILGDNWDARHLTHNYDVVINAFKSFYITGDVSRDLLS